MAGTDVASHCIPVLGDGTGTVTVAGRRGHVQGAFTIKELRELTRLGKGGGDDDGVGSRLIVSEDDLIAGTTESTVAELDPKIAGGSARPQVRIDRLLRDAAEASSATADADRERRRGEGGTTAAATNDDASIAKERRKTITLRFLLRPIEFLPSPSNHKSLGYVRFERTELTGPPGNQVATGTGETVDLRADLALVSIGYRGVPLIGMEDEDEDDDGAAAAGGTTGNH